MYKEFIIIWFTFYEQRTGEKYVFSAKDGMHLKQLIKKVATKVKQKGMDLTDENIRVSFQGLLQTIRDPWILDNLEVAIINSKFNAIYAKAIRNNPFIQRSRTDDLIDQRHSKGAK